MRTCEWLCLSSPDSSSELTRYDNKLGRLRIGPKATSGQKTVEFGHVPIQEDFPRFLGCPEVVVLTAHLGPPDSILSVIHNDRREQ